MNQELSIFQDLKQLGFSDYECKAYLSLLQNFPLNGSSLSKKSSVPRSRIYDVLENLINKKLVYEQIEEKNKLYYPVDPEICISEMKSDYDDVFSNISNFAKSHYRTKKSDDNFVVIKGRENIINHLKSLIKAAQNKIALSIWEEELNELVSEIDESISRGVALKGIFFGEHNPYADLVPHRRFKRHLTAKKERYTLISIDGVHSISGILSRGESSKVTWTQDEGLVEVGEDYIAHDVLINFYSSSLNEEELKRFEKFSANVYKKFFDYSDNEFYIDPNDE